MKSKKVLGVFNETYTKNYEKKKGNLRSHNLKLTLDILELMMKSKKKFLCSFLRNLVRG